MEKFDAGLVVRTISKAVGDPQRGVIAATHDYDTVDSWIMSQSGQSAAAGGLAVVVPFANIPAAMADFFILMHKVAYVCQGVAGLRKVPITKESGEVDLAVILGLWTEAVMPEDLGHMFETEAQTGMMQLPERRQVSPRNEFFECPLQTTSHILVVDKAGTKILSTLGANFLNRLARTLFVSMAVREGSKLAISIIPLIGAVVCGAINYRIVEAVGRAADTYYTAKRAFLDRQSRQAA